MDLRDGKITIGELERSPAVSLLLDRFVPRYRNHPLAPLIRRMSLNQAVALARKRGIPEETIQQGLELLRVLKG